MARFGWQEVAINEIAVNDGNAGQLLGINDAGTAAEWTNPPGGSAIVNVESTDDLPAAVAGVRTLVSGTIYSINTSIDLGADRLTCSGTCILLGPSPSSVTLQTTNAAALLTTTGAVWLRGLKLLNDSGPSLACTQAAGAIIRILHCIFNSAGTDTFTGAAGAVALRVSDTNFAGSSAGVSVSGNHGTLLEFDHVGFVAMTGSITQLALTSTAAAGAIRITGCVFSTISGQTALDIDSGIANGEVTGCSFSGVGTYFGSVDQDVYPFIFSGNSPPGLNSAQRASISSSDNATTLTLTDQNTWYQITTFDTSEFSGNGLTADHANDRITIANGVNAVHGGTIHVNFFVDTNNQRIQFGWSVDGGTTIITPVTKRKAGTGLDVGNGGMPSYTTVDASGGAKQATTWARNIDSGGTVLTVEDISFELVRED